MFNATPRHAANAVPGPDERWAPGWAPLGRRPSLDDDEVHVLAFDTVGAGRDLECLLDDGERRHAARLRSAPQRERYTAAHVGLRVILARYLGDAPSADLRFRTGRWGKPELAGDPGVALGFSLSHAGALAMIAVAARRPVGVDVEPLRPRAQMVAVAERAFDAETAAAVRMATDADRPALFYRAWTRLEAELKCRGTGLLTRAPAGEDSPSAPVALLELAPRVGYAAAVAVAGGGALRLRCFHAGLPT